MEIDDIRMPLTSADVTAERLEKLKELFPEAFTEGKVDFERLKQALGDVVDTGRERYGLSWAGKADAIRAVQTPSVGTLIPAPGESVNFDTTENLIIEGENLEVLKLLQKSYHGKVKMIYIDPPYNTGKEFIYPDDYQEPLKQYLRLTGQVSEEGVKLTTNTETSGRYHSNWLSMMYPRLFLARNLLRDDGAIFVSIDDHEVHNLRLLMDEIFGEENFVANIVWQKKYSPQNDAKWFSDMHDHILLYARDKQVWRPTPLARTTQQDAAYKNPDNDPRGPWKATDSTCNKSRQERPNLYYPIRNPNTGEEILPLETRVWRYSREVHEQKERDNRVWWGIDGKNKVPAYKSFLSEVRQGRVPTTIWGYKDVGHNQLARQELTALMPEDPFDTPKPTKLILRMLEIAASAKGDIVLDFFAGSGTTGHAVLMKNLEDGLDRQFILVQMREPIKKGSAAFEAGFESVADICVERVRRVIMKLRQKLDSEPLLEENLPQDLGFRILRLAPSNFKIWEGEKVPQDAEGLAEQLKLYGDHVLEGRSQRDILYELILKAGLPLTAKIEEKAVTGKTIYSVADGLLLICLEDEVTAELLRGMMDLKPQQIICLDRAFRGNDQLKTNTVLEMKQRKITFHTV